MRVLRTHGRIQRETYNAYDHDTLTISSTESSDKVTTYGSQTGISSLLASNASATRNCCSSQVFSQRYHVTYFQSNMNATLTSGTPTFQQGWERMTKEMTASASHAMKIKVVAPPVGISSWRQTLPPRGSVVPPKLSACRIHATSFPEQHDATFTPARICTPMLICQAARTFSKIF